MTLTKVLPQDLLNDIVPAGQDKPMVGASKYYGTNASGDFGFFPFAPSSVLQFANLAAFPVTGVANTLYIDSSTNQAYEWNGTGYDLLGDNEVQPYVNFAGFPATGSEGVTYIALDTDLTYVWDPTTSTYITPASGGGVNYTAAATAPVTPSVGDRRENTSKVPSIYNVWSGTARVEILPQLVDNTLFVDGSYGNDAFGLRERQDRPYQTLSAAIAASLPGDSIIIRNGDYAIGSITIPHELYIQADDGVNIISGTLVAGANNVSYKGGIVTSTAFMTYASGGKIDIEIIEYNVVGGTLLGTTTGPNVGNIINIKIERLINTGVAITQALVLKGNTNNLIDVQIENAIGNFVMVNANWVTVADNLITSKLSIRVNNYTTGTGQSRVAQILSEDSYIYIQGDSWTQASLPTPAASLVTGYYIGGLLSVNVRYFTGGMLTQLFGEATDILIDGYKHTQLPVATNGYTLHYFSSSYQFRTTRTTKSTVRYAVEYSYDNNSLDDTYTGATQGSTGGGSVIAVIGADLYVTAKEMVSLNGHPISWNRAYNSVTVPFQLEAFIYGTRLYRTNYTGVAYPGAGYNVPGLIKVQQGVLTAAQQPMILNLLDGVTMNAPFNYAIYCFDNANGSVIIKQRDDVVARNTTTGIPLGNIGYETMKREDKLSTTVALANLVAGVYTIVEYDKDINYDLSLGSATFRLPSALRNIDREIQIKNTNIHATNTLTVDSPFGGTIDGAASFVFPGTSTTRANYVFKSNGTNRYIK